MNDSDLSELQMPKERITDFLDFMERERDLLRFHNHPDRKFYIACEAQSSADYTIPLREFTYDGIEYTDQLKSKKHYTIKNGQAKYMLPVLHTVIYHGWTRWLSKHNLQEMMDIPVELESYRYLFPEYHSHIIDIHEQNPILFKTEWADIFRLMGHSRKKEELKQYMKEHLDKIRQLSMDTRMLLAILLDQYQLMDDGRIEVKDVCEAWDGALELMRDELRDEIRDEVRDKVRDELRNEVRDELRDKVRDELRDEVRDEVRDELRDEVRDEARDELRDEVRDETLQQVSKLFTLFKKENKLDILEKSFSTGGNILQLLNARGV